MRFGRIAFAIALIAAALEVITAVGCTAFEAASENPNNNPDDASSSSSEASSSDGATDENVADERCDLSLDFAGGDLVPGLADLPLTNILGDGRLTPDELTIFFRRGVLSTEHDLFRATRTSRKDPFGTPVRLTASTAAHDFSPAPTDGLTHLLFTSRDVDASEVYRLMVAPALGAGSAAPTLDFGPAVLVNVAGGIEAKSVYVVGNDVWLSGASDGSNTNIYHSLLTTVGSTITLTTPVPLDINTNQEDDHVVVSSDRKAIYWASTRIGSVGQLDVWTASRSDTTGPFSDDVHRLVKLSTAINEWPTWISPDSCRLYFTSQLQGGVRLYVARRSEPR